MSSHNRSGEGADSSLAANRRLFMKAAATGIPIAFAGCLGGDDDDTDTDADTDDDSDGVDDETEVDTDDSEASHGGELLWGGSVPVQSLDPHFESAAASAQVLENITQGLVRVNWDYEIEPLLAESWESSDDNLELTFTIRDGVQFHDGTELTADDVYATFSRIEEREALAADYMGMVDSIDAPNEETFVMELSEPFAPMLSRMATSHMHIVPAEQAEQDTINEPIGTGPFEFDSMELDSYFVMTRFEDYWDDDLPYLDSVTKEEISDDENRLNTFNAGELDFINDLPPRHAADLENDDDVDFIRRFPQSLVYLGLNCDEEPFDDIDARLALDYAIDKGEVMEAALYGQGQVAASPAAPDSEWEHPDLEPREQDYALAQEHLEAAGYPDGFDVTFQIPEQYNDQVTAAEVIEAQAAEVGINLDIQLITWSNWLSDVFEEQNFEATTSSYLALWYPDAGFHRPFHSEGAFFFTGWQDDEYEALVDDARQYYEIEDRAPYYHEAAEILQEKRSGHILLYWMPTLMARTHDFDGEVMSPDGSTFRFEDTWMN